MACRFLGGCDITLTAHWVSKARFDWWQDAPYLAKA